MKYRIVDVDNRASYSKEMSFDELKDYFEPDVEIFKWYYIMYVLQAQNMRLRIVKRIKEV